MNEMRQLHEEVYEKSLFIGARMTEIAGLNLQLQKLKSDNQNYEERYKILEI